MFKGWTNRWDELSVLADTAVAYAAYLLVVHVYLALHPHVASAQLVSLYFSWSIFVLATSWLGLKLSFRGYSRRWNQLPAEIAMLFLAGGMSGAGMAVVIFGLKATWFSRIIFVTYPAVAFVFQMIIHSATKVRLATWRRQGLDRRHLVVIGYPPRVTTFRDTVHAVPEAGMDVVGMAAVSLGDTDAGHSAVARLREWLTTEVVDSVVLALPLDDTVLREAIRLADSQGKEVRLVLDEVGALANRSQLYNFYGNSVLVVNPSQAHLTARWIVKRAVDLIGSLALLILTSPILVTVAALLKWREPDAPVLFRQERVGLNGRRFTCYKFRTMVRDAEALRSEVQHLNIMSGPVFKAPDDPRITPLGRKLRQYSLDELPQLFNVLWGQMSLVGPRPALPDEVEKYGESSRKRLSVRPGITGLWQVSGRNEIQDFERWVELDLEYIDRWSVGLDFAILARTIPAVLQQRGAH